MQAAAPFIEVKPEPSSLQELQKDDPSLALYTVGRNLAGDVMEPVLWTLDTYVGGLRFDQDLTPLEIKLSFL